MRTVLISSFPFSLLFVSNRSRKNWFSFSLSLFSLGREGVFGEMWSFFVFLFLFGVCVGNLTHEKERGEIPKQLQTEKRDESDLEREREKDREWLVQFHRECGGATREWFQLSPWGTSDHCFWLGVFCEEGVVVTLFVFF